MSTLQGTPPLKDIVESYVQYRKVAGGKAMDRSHKVYQLLHHAGLRSQGMLTPGLAHVEVCAGEMGHTADTSASKSGTVGGAHAAHLHTR